MLGFWEHEGKEQVGLVHLLVCVQNSISYTQMEATNFLLLKDRKGH